MNVLAVLVGLVGLAMIGLSVGAGWLERRRKG
jgi:hypothetical protein